MVWEKKNQKGETERSKNNLKQKEVSVELLYHILWVLILVIVSLAGVDYLKNSFLAIFISSFAGDLPKAPISFGP